MNRDNRPMNEDSKRALQKSLQELCKNMELTEVLTLMQSWNVFTEVDIQKIEVNGSLGT